MVAWQGVFDDADAGIAYCRAIPEADMDASSARRPVMFDRLKRVFTGDVGPAVPGPASRVPLANLSSPRPAGLDALVKLQSAAGTWELDDELARVIGHDLDDLMRAMPAAASGQSAPARAWATAVALAWLERHAAAQEGEWSALALKARQWLDRQFPGRSAEAASWQEAARSWLGSTIPF